MESEISTFSHSKLLREIVLTAIQKGNLDAKLKRYKYQSKNWVNIGKEYEEISTYLGDLESEYFRRFLKLTGDLDL